LARLPLLPAVEVSECKEASSTLDDTESSLVMVLQVLDRRRRKRSALVLLGAVEENEDVLVEAAAKEGTGDVCGMVVVVTLV